MVPTRRNRSDLSMGDQLSEQDVAARYPFMEIHPHPRLLHDLKNTDQACINLEEFAQLNCDGTQRFPVGSSMEIEIAPTAEIGLGQWTDWRAGRHIVVLSFCISIGQRLQHRELRQLLDQYR